MSRRGSDALALFGSAQTPRRRSTIGRAMSGLRGDMSAEIIEDREQGERLSRVKLAQGAAYRQSVCVQGPVYWASQLQSDTEKGLSSERAEALLKEHGPNEIQKAESKSIGKILLEQMNALNMLVVCGGILCFVQGTFTINGMPFGEAPDYFNGTILFVIVGVCIVVGAYMEWSCSRVIADVSHMSALSCTVIRDGAQKVVPSEAVVPGDLVVLRLGDAIPADCIVVQAAELQTNEIALTGEPYDISKTLQPKDLTSPFPSNFLYASTGVVNGTGKGLVIRTGMQTEIGKIAAMLSEEDVGLTSVQRTLNGIGAFITIVVICLTLGVFCVSYHMRVNDPADPCPNDDDLCFLQKSIMRSLFAFVGAIPESLQPACTFLLVMGCTTLKNLNAATLKLAAVDTIGACSFICSDKTGTLTEGKMTCMQLSCRVRGEFSSMGNYAFYPTQGLRPQGGVFDEATLTDETKKKLDAKYPSTLPVALAPPGEQHDALGLPADLGDPGDKSAEANLVRSCMMALFLNSCGTTLVEKDGVYSVQGNMSEGALVVAAAKAKISGPEPQAKYERFPNVELPFSSSRKMMVTIHKLPEGGRFEAIQFDSAAKYVAIVKGAPDVLLPSLSRVLTSNADGSFRVDDKELGSADTTWFEGRNQAMSENALRVLCVALRPLTASDFALLVKAEADADQRAKILLQGPVLLLGVVGLMDPPRASARSAIEECHKSGVRVAMITGDQTPTALAVAKSLGILQEGSSKENVALRVSECSALKALKDDHAAIDEICERVVVWSRAQPQDKVTIVESLQRQRHIVAMTGDGVNDAGALKKADVGLAMGIAGTDVTKNAADIILLDDRFATIIDAVSEGRRIFGNIQRMSAYMICCNVFDVLVMMAVMMLGWSVPLEQSQLFKANFITHMFYPWCLVFQNADYYSMMHPPRSRDKPLLPSLQRKIIIPLIFAAYFFLTLSAQYAGSVMYVGTALRDEQTGTSSINDFYRDDTSYTCLYANTMRLEHSVLNKKHNGNPSPIFYDRDVAPLFCTVKKMTFRGFEETAQYGRHDKAEPDEAIHGSSFNWLTGAWGDMFDLKHSFLAESFQGKVQNFQDQNWHDKKGWLEKCSGTTLKGKNGEKVAGDSDKLCWKDCGGVPCWNKAGKAAREAGSGHEASGRTQAEAGGHSSSKKNHEDEPAAKPVLYKKFNAGAWGVRQMRSLYLLTMVLIEFVMLYCFSSHDFSVPFLTENKAFPIAWVPMLVILLSYIYLPVFTVDQGFAPLDLLGMLVALFLVVAFFAAFEMAKVLHRSVFDDELEEKTAVAALLAEGQLHAFPSRAEAWIKCPKRRPLLAGGDIEHSSYGSFENEDAETLKPRRMSGISEGTQESDATGEDAV